MVAPFGGEHNCVKCQEGRLWRTVLVVLVPTHNQHGEALNALKWPTLAASVPLGSLGCCTA